MFDSAAGQPLQKKLSSYNPANADRKIGRGDGRRLCAPLKTTEQLTSSPWQAGGINSQL